MFSHLIKDHSPEYDYVQMRNRAVYEIEGADFEHWKACDSSKKLKSSPLYKNCIKIARGLLILAGVCLIITIIASVIHKTDSNDTARQVFIAAICIFGASLVFAGILAITAGFMEDRCEKKDLNDNIKKMRKTWILSDGCIAVSDEIYGEAPQITSHIIWINSEKLRNNIKRHPFEQLEIINNVHSVCIKNGFLVADADILLYYIKYPYNNTEQDDYTEDLSPWYKYFYKHCRKTIKWDADIQDVNVLMQACERLMRR